MKNVILLIALAQAVFIMEQMEENQNVSKFKKRRLERMQRVAKIRSITNPNYRLPATIKKPVIAVEDFKGYRSPAVMPVNSDI